MGPFKDHFSAASGYAAHRPVYPAALVDALAGLCARRDRVWDAGCGTGQLSVLLAERFGEVVATDASAEQIARALVHLRVRYAAAPAERSGVEDESVDLVVAAQAAHWFELPRFYDEVRRVARGPGAVVALVCYEKCVIDGGAIDAAVERVYSGVLGAYWPPERRHVEAGYRDLPFPFEEVAAAELPRLEMEAVWDRAGLVGYVNTWSAVRAAEKAGVTGAVEGLARELERVWPEGKKMVVRWPLSLRVGGFRRRACESGA
jgi:SAM-dependent methyltransferase